MFDVVSSRILADPTNKQKIVDKIGHDGYYNLVQKLKNKHPAIVMLNIEKYTKSLEQND